jgi:hypothetical protein
MFVQREINEMNRSAARSLAFAALAALATTALPETASAQTITCGITGSAVAQAAIYDPFGNTGLPTTRVTLTMQRINPAGGGKTALVAFYLTGQDEGSNNAIVTPISAAGSVTIYGTNQNIFYNYGTPGPLLNLATNTPQGYMIVEFTGNNAASDFVTVVFDIQLPRNLDIPANPTIDFDANYHCSGTGGGQPFEDEGVIPNAVSFPIKVLSGLQASYSGHVLDFGEVGDKTDADIAADQDNYTKSGWVNVRSSGPYTVDMVSQNGYLLTFPGGNPADPTQRLLYTATFAGQSVNNASPTYTTVICSRATLDTKQLPLTAELNEGGTTKAPSEDYQDIISITLAPLAGGTPGGLNCPAL